MKMRVQSQLDDQTEVIVREVIGAAIEVHRHLGPGFMESVYESALCVELTARRFPFVRQARFNITYKTKPVGEGRLDLHVADCVVLELKAIDALTPVHHAQVISYLQATGNRLGLLINFNVPVLRDGVRRIVV